MMAIAGMYVLFFAAVGILLPFFAVYLQNRGLSPGEIGILIAIGPTLSMLAPPWWGHRADKTGRPEVVLRWVGLGALTGLVLILQSPSFPSLFLSLVFYGLFSSAITPLLDSIAIEHVRLEGGAYSHLRMFGSVGFVISAVLFSHLFTEIDQTTIVVPCLCMLAMVLWSFRVKLPPRPHVTRLSPWAGLALLKRRDIALFLLATSLHWIASAPYHGLFGLHTTALGLSSTVLGYSSSAGVAAEIVVMFFFPRWGAQFEARHLMFLSFLITAFRWWALSLATTAFAIISLNLLHGLSFGLFYVAAISWLSRRVPVSMRAVGQTLFASVTFGVGGVVGFIASGQGYALLGGHRLFGWAAVLELLPCVLILALKKAPIPLESGEFHLKG